jgi:TIR domain
MPSQPKVAVSYSWREEADGANRGAVETFCAQLKSKSIAVVRDIERVKHGQSLSKFMREIGASDFLCVFLSDAYLRSPNCMYEMLIAWQRSKDNAAEFRQRVKAWQMPGLTDISKLNNRAPYIRHWMAEKAEAEKLIAEFATTGLAAGSLEQFNRIKEIGQNVDAVLQFCGDSLSPNSAESFTDWVAEQFSASTAALPEQVYENTVKGIHRVLKSQPTLGQFLADCTTGLLHKEASGWKLSASAKTAQFDVCRHLRNIADDLDGFRGQQADWRGLAEIVGGLVVLAIDPDWVSQQRELARATSTDYPGDKDLIHLGDRQANFLHLVASALADGRSRMEKVFGKPVLDKHQIPDPDQVMRGIGEADEQKLMKLHFIRYVLGPNQPIKEADDKQIGILFKRTKAMMKDAFTEKHEAYIGSGENFKRLTKLIRDQLEVQDLLLIHPSGDDPEALLTDHVSVLLRMGEIFDAVQANTRS